MCGAVKLKRRGWGGGQRDRKSEGETERHHDNGYMLFPKNNSKSVWAKSATNVLHLHRFAHLIKIVQFCATSNRTLQLYEGPRDG